jgi:hypothetical protein
MAGTTVGGRKAVKTIKQVYGKDFYAVQGAKGGAKSRDGGFAHTVQREDGSINEVGRELARVAGARGGKVSRRGPAVKKKESWLDYINDNDPLITLETRPSFMERVRSWF